MKNIENCLYLLQTRQPAHLFDGLHAFLISSFFHVSFNRLKTTMREEGWNLKRVNLRMPDNSIQMLLTAFPKIRRRKKGQSTLLTEQHVM